MPEWESALNAPMRKALSTSGFISKVAFRQPWSLPKTGRFIRVAPGGVELLMKLSKHVADLLDYLAEARSVNATRHVTRSRPRKTRPNVFIQTSESWIMRPAYLTDFGIWRNI